MAHLLVWLLHPIAWACWHVRMGQPSTTAWDSTWSVTSLFPNNYFLNWKWNREPVFRDSHGNCAKDAFQISPQKSNCLWFQRVNLNSKTLSRRTSTFFSSTYKCNVFETHACKNTYISSLMTVNASLLKHENTNWRKGRGWKVLICQFYKHSIVFLVAKYSSWDYTGQTNVLLKMLLC